MASTYEIVGVKSGSSNAARYNRSLSTRQICVIGISVSWIVGIGSLTAGAVIRRELSAQWPAVHLDRRTKEALPLLFNIFVTLVTECLGLVHATALRWALHDDLTFNSNLRLFTSPKSKVISLSRFANFWHAAFLVLTYVSTSLIFCVSPPLQLCQQIYDEPDFYCAHDESAVYISPAALIMLGIGFVGQAFITTFQMMSVNIPSWSSGPINTAWILQDTGKLTLSPNRCMRSVHDLTAPSVPSQPLLRQGNAFSAHQEIRRVLGYTWILTLLAYAWFAALYIGIAVRHAQVMREDGDCADCDVYPGSDWSLLPDSHNYTSLADITNFGEVDPNGPGGEYLAMFLLIYIFQVFVTMGLHCAELIVNMSRDEDVWRGMTTEGGYRTDASPIVAAMKSWKTGVLLVLKPVVHWIFGLGMAYYYGWGVFMRPPQILYLAIVLTVLALFSTALCLRRPKGPQPATYGHLKTVVNLIDEWHTDMFWGHKGERMGVAHAGTSASRLPMVSMDQLYAVGGKPEKDLEEVSPNSLSNGFSVFPLGASRI